MFFSTQRVDLRFFSTILFCLCLLPSVLAQKGQLKGKITAEGQPIIGATIGFPNLNMGTTSDLDGQFELINIPVGTHDFQISYLGYKTHTEVLAIKEGSNDPKNIELFADYLHLSEVVVTGTKKEVPLYNAPIIISRIDSRVFSATQSLSLSEGLSFSPGLRLENNCQNCGFTQLRMNGLNGPYTQILINSRPIFSALTGVYGLDMIPANMIERVEVIRGGGSALYGGNAIAGIVNILTKQPIKNSFETGINYGFTDLEVPDRTITANGSIVGSELDKGVSIYAYNRDRKDWDKDGDGFSEMTQLRNTTFGLDAFLKPGDRSIIQLNVFNINEFRRGGSMEDRPPHQTPLAEQLNHNIIGGALSFEQMSKNLKHKWAIYTSAQSTNRESYYGAGGRVLSDGDTLTPEDIIALNAYGNSDGISLVSGMQYSYDINKKWLMMAGTEFQYNRVEDKMPGYNRVIDQQTKVLGSYAQIEIKPIPKLSMSAGGRLDVVHINGTYGLGQSNYKEDQLLVVAVPRVTIMYQAHPHLKLRSSFAQGYRAPQAFDEDLHIETVGGSARFIRLADDLTTEKSNSATFSINYTNIDGKVQTNIVVEGFYTNLKDAFIIANQEALPGGIIALTKRNGDGTVVQGINAEASLAFSRKFNFQLGGTFQSARYKSREIIWEPAQPEDGAVLATKKVVRTPDLYGFFTLNYQPIENLSFSFSGVATGKMDVPHMIVPATGETVMKQSRAFMELNTKWSYHFDLKNDTHFEVLAGMQNIFNSFQQDIDTGQDRDASYIYGPSRPRTLFVGLKFGLH